MLQTSLQAEEQVVAELARLGVGYLSRLDGTAIAKGLLPQDLLAALVRQPSSRVRVAVVALLLAHPEYAQSVPESLTALTSHEAQTLKFFYCAAVYLQEMYAETLHYFIKRQWKKLPDLYSSELGVSGSLPEMRLQSLARLHTSYTMQNLNWAGTYENAARDLLRRWQVEQVWKV